MSKYRFYRGYVSSREINGNVIPQSLQNLKIRDYANSKNLGFKLSITEHKSNNGFLALNDLKEKITSLRYLTPGDFAAVIRQNRFNPIENADDFVNRLKSEVEVKSFDSSKTMGFIN